MYIIFICFVCRSKSGPVSSFTLSTIQSHDFVFQCVAAEDFNELLQYLLNGMKERSHYVIATKDYTSPGLIIFFILTDYFYAVFFHPLHSFPLLVLHPLWWHFSKTMHGAASTVCLHTFTLFWSRNTSVIIKTFQLSFCVFVCAFRPQMSSFFR